MGKFRAYFLMIVFALFLSGCNSEPKEEENTVTEYFSEEKLKMPEKLSSCFDFRCDDNGDYLAIGQALDQGTIAWKSQDEGKTWEAYRTLPEEWKKSLVTEAQFTEDGGIFCIIAKDALNMTDQVPTVCFIYVTPEGQFEEKKMAAEKDGLSDIVCQNGIVYGRNTNGMIKGYDYKTGEEKKSFGQSDMFVNQFTLAEDRIIAIGIDRVDQYDLNTGAVLETSEKMSSSFVELSSRNQGYNSKMCYDAEENVIFHIGIDGMFRYDIEKERLEQMLYGENHAFSDVKGYLTDVSMLDNKIVINYVDKNRKPIVWIYTYVEEGIQVKMVKELTVYSLWQDNMMQDLVNKFNSAQDKIHANYEYDVTWENGVTPNDAISKLNTKIAAGDGPDVLLLDKLNADSYIENGLLRNISSVLDEKEHYTNIAAPFERDGKIYGVPMEFHLMAIHAEKKAVNSIGSLGKLADYLENYHKAHPDRLTLDRWESDNYMEVFFQTYFPDLLEDEKLEKEELGDFYMNLERIHHVSEYDWTVNRTGEGNDMISLEHLWLSDNWWSEGILAMGELDVSISGVLGCDDVERLYYYGDIRKGLSYDYFRRDGKPIFVPRMILAASGNGRYGEEAEDFISYCLTSKAMKERMGGNGFPINREAFKYPFTLGTDDKETMKNSKGKEIELPCKSLPKKEQEKFFDMVNELEEYTYIDTTIKEIVMEQAEKYINGEGTLEECTALAAEKVNLYQQE